MAEGTAGCGPVDLTTKRAEAISTQYSGQDAAVEAAIALADACEGTIHLLAVIPDNLLKGFYPGVQEQKIVEDTKEKLDAIAQQLLHEI